MPITADPTQVQTATHVDLGAIFVSLELSKSTWLVTALSPSSAKMSRHSVTGGDIAGLFAALQRFVRKPLGERTYFTPLVVIQEAGLDGFWLGRVLSKEAWIESHIVEAASIAMPRRHRRAKDYQPVNRDRRQRLEEHRTGDGRPLSKHLKGEICRELDRLRLLLTQIKSVEAERDALIVQDTPETPKEATALLGIKGTGPEFATILYTEGLFRHFDNRRQIASYVGLAPSPWQSGNVNREQGVSKAGNPRLRATMVELAWLWLRHQPRSTLTLWFKERIARNAGRLKTPMIVAPARKLLVALWKYVSSGVVIEGAIMKTA